MSGYNKKYDVSTCNFQCVGIGLRSETIMNIYDIAKLSGVSIATVSRVINNSPKVSHLYLRGIISFSTFYQKTDMKHTYL